MSPICKAHKQQLSIYFIYTQGIHRNQIDVPQLIGTSTGVKSFPFVHCHCGGI